LKVTFLGTGTSQGVPVIACDCPVCLSEDIKDKRLRTSAHIEVGGLSLVIDSGPDFRQQMLSYDVKQVDAILFTHCHKDHTAGLDDVRAYNYIQKTAMPVYADVLTQQSLKQEFSYIFSKEQYPGIPQVMLKTITDHPFTIADIEIIPIPVLHLKLPVYGFRIGDFAYVTDANYIPPASMEKLKGLKVLVLNALRKEEHISHFNLKQAIEVVQNLQPQKAYFTHISHLLGKHADVSYELPPNIELAYDGLSIVID
jgi:phosphoribosyl 1,2-cyclic phosphate phosphodiesterase